MDLKLKQHTEADEKFGITVNYLLNLASRAYELFESSKIEQKRQLINFLLSNLQLRGELLEYKLKKPFDVLEDLDYRSNWLGILNTFRTEYYYYIIVSSHIETFNIELKKQLNLLLFWRYKQILASILFIIKGNNHNYTVEYSLFTKGLKHL